MISDIVITFFNSLLNRVVSKIETDSDIVFKYIIKDLIYNPYNYVTKRSIKGLSSHLLVNSTKKEVIIVDCITWDINSPIHILTTKRQKEKLKMASSSIIYRDLCIDKGIIIKPINKSIN